MNYYDAILMVIPVLLTAGGGIAMLTELSLQFSLAISAGLSLLVLAHGLFVRPPMDSEEIPRIDSTEASESSLLNSPSIISDD